MVTNNTNCTERGGGGTDLGTILKTKHSFRWFPNNQFPQSTCWVLQIQIGNLTRLVGKMLKSVMQLNSINFWYCFQFHGNSHEQASNAVLTDKWPHNVVLVTFSQKNINRTPYLEGIKSSCPIFFVKPSSNVLSWVNFLSWDKFMTNVEKGHGQHVSAVSLNH